MTQQQVAEIIFREVKRAGYVVTERKSVSTSSVYYTLSNGKCSLFFRVADHRTNSNVITLRLDHKISMQSAEAFVKNRIRDLGYRSVKMVLGL